MTALGKKKKKDFIKRFYLKKSQGNTGKENLIF